MQLLYIKYFIGLMNVEIVERTDTALEVEIEIMVDTINAIRNFTNLSITPTVIEGQDQDHHAIVEEVVTTVAEADHREKTADPEI